MQVRSDSRGFTLIEVLVAMSIMVTVAIGVVQLFAIAATAGRASRDRTLAVLLATGKLEQLRALEWRTDLDDGVATLRTDGHSDLSVEPASAGGTGLSESPPGTLDSNIPPFVDYLDRFGRRAATGPSPPPDAVYIRRWAIRHAPSDPSEVVALQVLVTTVRREVSRIPSVPHGWNGEDALLSTLVTRKTR
jgi:prepilin-type N-terminal cleavage/methylation domain-containing protein